MKRFIALTLSLLFLLHPLQAQWATVLAGSTPVASGPTAILSWLMTEGSGTSLADSSGNGNTGYTGGATWSNSSPPGGASYYLVFNGTNYGYTNLPFSSLSHNIVTLDCWIYSDNWAGGAARGIAGCGYPNNGVSGWCVERDSTGKIKVFIIDATGETNVALSSSAPSNSVWHHLQVVINNSNGTAQAYLDSGGNILGAPSGTWATPGNFSTTYLLLAVDNAIPDSFPGSIALFQIFAGDTHTL